MRFTIQQNKKDTFIALFQIIKNNTSTICFIINSELTHIQGIDKSHICLFDININNSWFNNFEFEGTEEKIICFDTQTFYNIINSASVSQSIHIYTNDEIDNLYIDLITEDCKNKNDFNKQFKLSLNENEHEILSIPESNYNCDMLICSKKICDLVNQMSKFGADLSIKVSENNVVFSTYGDNGEMNVKMDIDDFDEIIIDEDIEGHEFKYSIHYITKMCLTDKLCNKIYFYLSKDLPMKIYYDLEHSFTVCFYIAPKVSMDI